VPWTASEAKKHNRAVKSPKRQRQWAATANAILARTHDDARAIRGANSVVKKTSSKRTRKRA
jgi:hypothetical protein